MKTIWFRQKYVEPILSGAKAQTVRARCRYDVGETVQATVGPRPAFARLLITDITPLGLQDLPAAEQAEYRLLYPGITKLIKINFDLVSRGS